MLRVAALDSDCHVFTATSLPDCSRRRRIFLILFLSIPPRRLEDVAHAAAPLREGAA